MTERVRKRYNIVGTQFHKLFPLALACHPLDRSAADRLLASSWVRHSLHGSEAAPIKPLLHLGAMRHEEIFEEESEMRKRWQARAERSRRKGEREVGEKEATMI